MNFKKLSAILLVLGIGLALSFIVYASSKDDIVYPVAELGNCSGEQKCMAYCDQPKNMKACLAFAEKHNLFSAEELAKAKKFLEIGDAGPGGCANAIECENYCNNINHIDECLAFAEERGFMEPDELEEARAVQRALAGGAQLPGGCTNKDSCEAYCQTSNHMKECIEFAEKAGFIPPEELAEAKKVLVAIERGITPPPCMGREECDAYCSEPEHFEGCMTFAAAAGLIPEDEIEEMQMVLKAIKQGATPPPCRGKDECDAYCSEPEHFEQCVSFAEAAGFMNPKEVEMARKTGGKGPGNCRGREECEAFCKNPANQETCFSFAKEHGMISEEDTRQMKEGRKDFNFEQFPPEVKTCIENALGRYVISEEPQNIGPIIEQCFREFGAGEPPHDGDFVSPPPGGKTGICPAMPTVASCPEGQRMELIFSSPECGEYHTCVPKGESPSGEIFQGDFEQQYQQQYEQQYQQFQEQYQPPEDKNTQGFLRKAMATVLSALQDLLK